MIKDIVVNLSIRDARDPARDFAISTAAAFNAQLAGAHLAGMALLFEPLMSPMVDMYGIPPEVIESQRIGNEKLAKAAVARFDESARTRRAEVGRHPHARRCGCKCPGLFAQVARRFDLSIVGQPEPDTAELDRLIVEAALFDSGRPVLVVPYIQRAGLRLDHVMLCWDGSRSAARAAGDAMPFFRRSKLVEVVIVGSEVAKSDEIRGADIASHLARHGAKVELKRINTTETDVAGIILSQAADMSTDFMIMGGYGHSRLREFILGGVTREILASMTVPVLMSH